MLVDNENQHPVPHKQLALLSYYLQVVKLPNPPEVTAQLKADILAIQMQCN